MHYTNSFKVKAYTMIAGIGFTMNSIAAQNLARSLRFSLHRLSRHPVSNLQVSSVRKLMATVGSSHYRTYDIKESVKTVRIDYSMELKQPIIKGLNRTHATVHLPKFRSSASLKLRDISDGEIWKVGYVQAISKYRQQLIYGSDGVLCHHLEKGKPFVRTQYMVNDTQDSSFPWYNRTTASRELRGPAAPQTIDLSTEMNSDLVEKYQWKPPVHDGESPGSIRRLASHYKIHSLFEPLDRILPTICYEKNTLSHISYHIEGVTGLGIRCFHSGGLRFLDSVKWRVKCEIGVDCLASPGEELRILETDIQIQPGGSENLSKSAFSRPCVNDCKSVVWYPEGDSSGSQVLMKSKWE